MAENVTLASISRACGVSHITASRALRGMRNVKPETAQRIRDYADSIGYKPNQIARSLAHHRNGPFHPASPRSIVVPYNEESTNRDGNFLFWECLEGAVSAAATKKSSIEVMGFENGSTEFDFIRTLVESDRVAGVLDFGLKSETIDYLICRKIPVVSRLKGVYGLVNGRNAVYPDHIQGYFLAWRHLLDFGHQRVGFIGGDEHRAHFNECLAATHLTSPPSRLEKDIRVDGSRDAKSIASTLIAELGQWSPETWPSAFFCANDEVAQLVILALKGMNLSVPEQVSLIGFDDSHFARFCDPPLTTLRNPRKQIGSAAFHLLAEIIEAGPESRVRTEVLAMEFVMRQSVHKRSRSTRSEKSKTIQKTAV